MEASIPSVDDLQALFLLYCSVGRSQRVVLGSTDGLYGVRLQSARDIDTMTQKGFEIFVRDLPGLSAHPRGSNVPSGFIFTSNVGVTKIAMSPGGNARKTERFELRFDHWLDALKALAVHVYSRDLPSQSGVSIEDVSLATLLTRHVRPLVSKRFLGTDQVGPDPSLDAHSAAGMGVAPASVEQAWDWATANGCVGRPLTTRLVLTEVSVKSDVEAFVAGLRGVPLVFRELQDTERYAMRLRARLTSFVAAEVHGGASAARQANTPGTPRAYEGAEDAGGLRGAASSASSSIQMSLSPSLAQQAAPSVRDKVVALSSAMSSSGAGDAGFTADRVLGPATAAALARAGPGPSPLSRVPSMRVAPATPTARPNLALGAGGQRVQTGQGPSLLELATGIGSEQSALPQDPAALAQLTNNLQQLLAQLTAQQQAVAVGQQR